MITLFSGPLCPESHRVRISLAEKEVAIKMILVEGNRKPEDLSALNPYNSVPTLVDRDVVLYEPRIIMEYLEERFPYPPLMPMDLVERARLRLGMYHIETEFCEQMKKSLSPNPKTSANGRKALHETFTKYLDAFKSTRYFLSDHFSVMDCSIAAILWRLPGLNIDLSGPQYKPIEQYCKRVFTRPSFRRSLTEAEADLEAIE